MDVDRDMRCAAQQALLDAFSGPAFSVDRDYRYLAFNEPDHRLVFEMYGTSIRVGSSLLDAVTIPDERTELRSALDRALAGETHSAGGWYGSNPDERAYYTITYTPVRAEDGGVVGVAAVAVNATDLTTARQDLERVNASLRLSEQKYEAAFRSSPDAININRLSDGRYIEINTGFTRLTGFTEADVEGKSSLDISIWEDTADRDRLVAGLTSRGRVDRLEARFRAKDGHVTSAEMSARIIDIGGVPCILSVTRDISERKAVQAALEASNESLERLSHDVIETLGRVVETRDPYTQGHEERSAGLCRQIAVEMGLSEDDVEGVETAALVHDIGKLSIPSEILTKPGRLSKVEYDLIKEHPRNGYELLKDIHFTWPIADMVLQHHERMDGSGYPDGLLADEIDVPARILAVADVVEAMSTDRPYRASLGLDAAVDELKTHPSKYDAKVVEAFLALCDGNCVKL